MKKPDVLKNLGPNGYKLAVVKAWRNLSNGNGTRQEFEVALYDLIDMAGYERRPSYGEWIARTKTPEGFGMHSALSNARAEVVQVIMDAITMDDEELVRLEKFAIAESQGKSDRDL